MALVPGVVLVRGLRVSGSGRMAPEQALLAVREEWYQALGQDAVQ